jgi:hypothetical protein
LLGSSVKTLPQLTQVFSGIGIHLKIIFRASI